MSEPADGTQEVIRAVKRSEDSEVIRNGKDLVVTDQDENWQVFLRDMRCSQNRGSFLGINGVAQNEQIKRAIGDDPVDSVVRAEADIETSPQQEQLTRFQ